MLSDLINGSISQDEYCQENDIKVLLAPLPTKVEALVTKKNDKKLVILNRSLSSNKIKKALLHELIHIEQDHLYLKTSEDVKEKEVKKIIKEYEGI